MMIITFFGILRITVECYCRKAQTTIGTRVRTQLHMTVIDNVDCQNVDTETLEDAHYANTQQNKRNKKSVLSLLRRFST